MPIPKNLPEMKERLERQQQVLTRIAQQWLELERRLDELEARLPPLPEKAERNDEIPRKPR